MRNDILDREKEILQWISEEQSKNYICQQLHCKPETLNKYLQKMNIQYSGQKSKKGQKKGGSQYKPALYYIEGNIPINSHKLKQKLIRDNLKEEKCELCGLVEWMGIKLPLELHHKDGNHFNNDLSNLSILCPNCHAVQGGNSGANIENTAKFLIDEKNFCCDCGKIISKHATRCKSCASKNNQKDYSKRPEREQLKELIRSTSFLQIGRMFGVSDNAVRKWCDTYGLPRKATEIKNYSKEDWDKI